MKNLCLLLFITMVYSCSKSGMNYPETTKVPAADSLYGTFVEDPYRWLEDDNSEETAAWVEAQNKVTFDYLNQLPGREKIKARLTELWNFPKAGTPFQISGRWFMYKNDGLQNQSVLYTMDTPDDEAVVLLDPNSLSEDGTIALAGMDVSPDGNYLVYKIARSGSDWNEIFVKDIDSGELLGDHIQWVKFSGISCFRNGFFYSAYDRPSEGKELSVANTGQKIFFHQYGQSQENDELIFSNPDHPKRNSSAGLDEKREHMFIFESESTSGNSLLYKSLLQPGAKLISIAPGFEYDYLPVEMNKGRILVLTNDGAPRYRLVSIDPASPSPSDWEEIIPEKENTLQWVSLCGGKLFAAYMVDAKSKLEIYSLSGEYSGEVGLPGICSVGSFNGKPDSKQAFYSYSSFNTPGTIFRYDIESGESVMYFRPEVKFNPDDYVVKQEFYSGKDGTRIPMFLFHKKGIEQNGKNPAMLYGYGGFNISETPEFSTTVLFYVESGGVYAVANIRGGGEYGEDWHQAGTKRNKQNVFDDFIAAAEYLIGAGYTNSEQLTIRGGSNGGLLIGAVTNQRPDLMKVALPAVGVMDMLRYHKFTIGWAWAGDYGTVDDSEEMFRYLYGYSPYHNVKVQNYPAILATTADHDDRVVPAHTFKYISKIQELNTGKLPTLVRIDVKSGHGSGKPTAKIIEEYADLYAFVFHHTGIDY
ncbi:MAG TPA: prolyl oligopeptidase family serine peptidase [Prolixibacteraceae bacterium]|nr:prolyl oligopeptidase family serine peptidase [Prolixibacteraceae bacterium]